MNLDFGSIVGNTQSGAFFSDDRLHRYTLWRRWDLLFGDDPKQLVAFIGLNPSTADENSDDPTMRRCISFAKQWGFSGFVMLNLFGYRATDPKVMKQFGEPVGSLNDAAIKAVVGSVGKTVCAWGVHGVHLGRDKCVLELIRGCTGELFHLGLTQDGHPKHPLYLSKDSPITRWT